VISFESFVVKRHFEMHPYNPVFIKFLLCACASA
jgi:hypothetical protein